MNVNFELLPVLIAHWIISFFPEWSRWFIASLLVIGPIIGVFCGLFAVLVLVERKGLGRMQNRLGPNRVGPFGVLQPMADGIKMLIKEDIVPATADHLLHFLAPVLLVFGSLLVFAVIPYGKHLVPVELETGLIFFFAGGAASELSIFLAGWSSRNKYSLLGAMRALAQMLSYEIPLILSAVPAVLIGQSLSLTKIVAAQEGYFFNLIPHWFVFTPWGALGLLLFFIASMAETNRSPFDLPEAESELIAGHLTEYSGFKYALFFMAEYLAMISITAVGVTLFLGGWQAPLPVVDFIPSYVWFMAKLCAVLWLFIWIRATVPRLRIDQLMAFAWKFMIPLALINILVAAMWFKIGNADYTDDLLRWALSLGILASSYVIFAWLMTPATMQKGRVYRFAE